MNVGVMRVMLVRYKKELRDIELSIKRCKEERDEECNIDRWEKERIKLEKKIKGLENNIELGEKIFKGEIRKYLK